MASSAKEIYTTNIKVEGGILPRDILHRVAARNADLPDMSSASYGLHTGQRLNEVLSRAWADLVPRWKALSENMLPGSMPAASATRSGWLLPLLNALEYREVVPVQPVVIEDRSFPITHRCGTIPMLLTGTGTSLDAAVRTSERDGPKASPHSVMQSYLNQSADDTWGLVSNGLTVRLMRDSRSLTRQSFIEFDLQSIMEGEQYADFCLFWLLCHCSRLRPDEHGECWLDLAAKQAHELGVRVLDGLRRGVERAIEALGEGFLRPPQNTLLRQRLDGGLLTRDEYYQQLLRLVYQLIFVFVAEDRDLLHDPEASPVVRDIYHCYYSADRLRRMAEGGRFNRHTDLYASLRITLAGVRDGCPQFGIAPLGGALFAREATADLEECALENRSLLKAVEALTFFEDRSQRHRIDYRNMRSEELGSVYEGLLEQHPAIDTTARTFTLDTAAGSERKTSGSYYTPDSLVQCLLDSALEPVIREAMTQPDPAAALLSLKVCDPACGSGHFLVSAAHRIARRLAAVRSGGDEAGPAALRHALRQVVAHCLYGVDSNPMAVELCRLALWMEALEPGKPLSFLDHHIQCGNSLLGTTPELMAAGLPQDAFEALQGDDKKVCTAAKKQNAREQSGQIAMLLSTEAATGTGLVQEARQLERLPIDTIEQVKRQESAYERLRASQEYRAAQLLANAWCAAFVWDRSLEAAQKLPQITTGTLNWIAQGMGDDEPGLQQEVERIARQYQFFHWHLAFPDVFAKEGGGFNAVLGNPPWEQIQMQEKQWFANRNSKIATAKTKAIRSRLIEKLAEDDPQLYSEFKSSSARLGRSGHILKKSGMFPLCARGKLNTYPLFTELQRTLVSARGRCGIIVPSGICTDDTTSTFFGEIVRRGSLVSLYDFENKKLFAAIDSRIRFSLVTMCGRAVPATSIRFVFFAHSTEELAEPDRVVTLNAADFALMNPNTLTCPIFKSARDATITRSVYARVPVLIREVEPAANPWAISFMQGLFNMASKSKLFVDHPGQDLEPLYEAKMLHHYNHRWATYISEDEVGDSKSVPLDEDELCVDFELGVLDPEDEDEEPEGDKAKTRDSSLLELSDPDYTVLPRYWIARHEVDKRLTKRDDAGNVTWQWDRQWLLGWRDITNTTNERTLIASFLPRAGVGHTLPIIFTPNAPTLIANLLANFNGIALDYVARQKVGGTHMTYGYLNQLPILPPEVYGDNPPASYALQPLLNALGESDAPATVGAFIAPRVLELVYTANDMTPWARDMGWQGAPFSWEYPRRLALRCELDALYFQLYGIGRDDTEYILHTFPIVQSNDEKLYGEYRTARLVLEMYDEMARAMATGQRYLSPHEVVTLS